MSKNIVVLSDGTGQEGGKGNNTNIYKIFQMLENRTTRQVVFYDAGLGAKWWDIPGKVNGLGITKNILQCYRFIFDHYEAGDSIYMFGFSRGAATVRSLSSFLHYFGVLPKSRPELIAKAYKKYKTRDEDKRKERAKEFILKHHTMWAKVKFLGCFDTVAALGLPFKPASVVLDGLPFFRHSFHNYTLSETVENAYHALAIDDVRLIFHPVLWKQCNENQTMRQVWFAGMHTDVGGGYEEKELSDIPLQWMVKKATDAGLLIYKGHRVSINGKADGEMHDSRGTFITKLYRKKTRFWELKDQKPLVHQSVLDRTLNEKNKKNPPYKPWILKHKPDVEPW